MLGINFKFQASGSTFVQTFNSQCLHFCLRARLATVVLKLSSATVCLNLIHSFIYFIHSFVMLPSQSFICILFCIHYLILKLHNTFVYVRFYIATVLFHSIRRSRVTGLPKSTNCHDCHGNFGQVTKPIFNCNNLEI